MTLMMAVGVFAVRGGIVDKSFVKGFSSLLVNVLIPCMAFSVMVKNYEASALSTSLEMMLGCIGVLAVGTFVGLAAHKLRGKKDDLSFLLLPSVIFMNANILGFPVIESLYGEQALIYANFFMIPFRPFFYTVMPLLIRGRSSEDRFSPAKDIFHALLSPSICATLLGLVVALCGIKLPAPLFSAVDRLGSTVSSLGMVACGMYISSVSFSAAISNRQSWLVVLCRNILSPALTLALFLAVGVSEDICRLCVIFAAMPVASMTALFAGQYGRNSALAASSVFLSTSSSMLTIPLWSLLLEKII